MSSDPPPAPNSARTIDTTATTSVVCHGAGAPIPASASAHGSGTSPRAAAARYSLIPATYASRIATTSAPGFPYAAGRRSIIAWNSSSV